MPLYGSSTIQGAHAQQRLLLGHQPQPGRDDPLRLVLEDRAGPRRRVPVCRGAGVRRPDPLLQPERARGPSTTTAPGGVTTTPARESYQVNGALSQRISKSFRARGRVDYFSNISVQQTYSQNIFVATNHQRVMNGSVNGVIGTFSLNGSLRPQRVLLRHDAVHAAGRHAAHHVPARRQAPVRNRRSTSR
jgi:hypothetical protein